MTLAAARARRELRNVLGDRGRQFAGDGLRPLRMAANLFAGRASLSMVPERPVKSLRGGSDDREVVSLARASRLRTVPTGQLNRAAASS